MTLLNPIGESNLNLKCPLVHDLFAAGVLAWKHTKCVFMWIPHQAFIPFIKFYLNSYVEAPSTAFKGVWKVSFLSSCGPWSSLPLWRVPLLIMLIIITKLYHFHGAENQMWGLLAHSASIIPLSPTAVFKRQGIHHVGTLCLIWPAPTSGHSGHSDFFI